MTTTYLQADVANVLAEIDALLAAYPDLAEDEELRRDVLEGETSAFEVLQRLLGMERDAVSMAKAIDARVAELQARKKRMEKRKEVARILMLRVLQAADIQKAQLPEATISLSKGRESVEIVDESSLPDWAFRIKREPNRTAIMEKLAANENVPGAVLKPAQPTVTVRVG